MVTVVTAGVAVVADVGLVGAGVGDGVLETGASVGAGNVAVDPDAASGKGATATVGEALVGSSGARVSAGVDPTVGTSGEHANRSRAMPARKTRMVFFMASGN